MDFDLADLIGTGHAARGMLTAVERFCTALTEETLKAIALDVENNALTAEHAVARCHEVAAYRRIVMRLRQRVVAGEHAAAHQAAALTERANEDSYA